MIHVTYAAQAVIAAYAVVAVAATKIVCQATASAIA